MPLPTIREPMASQAFAIGTRALAGFLGVAVAPLLRPRNRMSPYMAKIVGQEDFVYVWTLGTLGSVTSKTSW